MPKTDQWAKYDEALAFLREQEPGSYFDEIADLMEQLIARVVEHEAKPEPLSQRAIEFEREQALVMSALARRMASYSAAKKSED